MDIEELCEHGYYPSDNSCEQCTNELLTKMTADFDQTQANNQRLTKSLQMAGGAIHPMLPFSVMLDSIINILAPDPVTQMTIKLMTEHRMTEVLENSHKELRLRKLTGK
jgi:hypothetical protein